MSEQQERGIVFWEDYAALVAERDAAQEDRQRLLGELNDAEGERRSAAAARDLYRDALERIANRYCLRTRGDKQAESACLHRPSDEWCSVCIARAALAGETDG